MKKYIFLAFQLLIGYQVSNAQSQVAWTLSEAINSAMTNNKSIQATSLNREINRYQKGELQAALFPTINGSAGINHYIDLPQQFLPANFLNPQAPEGEVVGATFGVPNAGNVGVSAQWMIYNQAIFNSFDILKVRSAMTDIEIEKEKEKVAASVTQLYYGISFAQEQKNILEQNITSVEELYKIVVVNFENGFVTRNEVDKIKVNQANLESQLNNLNTTIQTQKNLLKLFTGLPNETDIELLESFEGKSLAAITTKATSPTKTTDYQILRKQMELTGLDRKNLKANYLPTVSLMYQYQYNWQSDNLGDLFGSDLSFPQQSIGLSLNVPIFDGRRNKFKLEQNEVKIRQLNEQGDYLTQKLSTDITNARLQYNQNILAIDTRQANVELAEKVYQQSTYQFQEGIIALNEVINSETALREAQTQYLNAVSTALLARLDYKKATGTILQ